MFIKKPIIEFNKTKIDQKIIICEAEDKTESSVWNATMYLRLNNIAKRKMKQ